VDVDVDVDLDGISRTTVRIVNVYDHVDVHLDDYLREEGLRGGVAVGEPADHHSF
jgi:hypothetical protein